MADNSSFAVRIELASSIITGQRLTLDGLLASLIFERTRSLELAHNAIPLMKINEVWAGSAALVETPAPIRSVAIIQSLRAQLDVAPSMIVPEKRGYPRIETARGDYRNKMSSYAAYDAGAIWFSGCGDVDEVRNLIEGIHGVGTKRNIGHGKVKSVHIRRTESDRSGLAFSDGTPARPVPIRTWEETGGIDCERALETYCPPYWNGNRVVCALPSHQLVSPRHAKRLVGLTSPA